MPVEKLDVAIEILVQISATCERPANRPHGVDGNTEQEEQHGSEPSLGEALEPGERMGEAPARYGCSAAAATRAGLRKRWMSCRPPSTAGRKATGSRSPASFVRTYSGGW
jgi:hypothetical protein